MPELKRDLVKAVPGLMIVLLFFHPMAAADGFDIQPAVVPISSFFSGVQMQITADLPPGSQAVLGIRGKRIEEELMRKSHHWELWIDSGEVDIENAPMLYILLSSTPELLSPGSIDLPWGYDALRREARFTGKVKPAEDDRIFDEFVQLKERDKLYHLYPGELKILSAGADLWQARANFHLPSRLKPGAYHVMLWIVRDGKVAERRDGSFEVRRTGLADFLYGLASKHGVLYGFLAVAIAMISGILTGLAFHRKGGAH